jgi:hypothetical protein
VPKLSRLAVPFVLCFGAFFASVLIGLGFTVDDALISSRVAHHLAQGSGYRFNPDGEVVDCVTPLGWAFVLWPSASTPLSAFAFARVFGVGCVLVSSLLLAYQVRKVPWQRLALVLLPVALCLPLGAWASAGMETPLVLLLVALGLGRGTGALVAVGAAAALRPELIPYAVAVAAMGEAKSQRLRLLRLVVVLVLPLAVVALRVAVFGQPAPLAVLAKPSDFESGLRYAVGGTVLLGLPALLVAFHPWKSLTRHSRSLAVACVVHVGALLVVGGDWMALFRLFVPIVPTLSFVAAELANVSSLRAAVVRSAVATLICSTLLVVKGGETRGVLAHRLQLIEEAGPALSKSFHVATLDVGWVGATTRAPVLDLAGLTDVDVAVLPGGHTSKRLPRDFLLRREPDTLVLLLASGVSAADANERPWTELPFARAVEQRLTQLDGANEFVLVATLELGGTNQRYLVLRRLTDRLARVEGREKIR